MDKLNVVGWSLAAGWIGCLIGYWYARSLYKDSIAHVVKSYNELFLRVDKLRARCVKQGRITTEVVFKILDGKK